jgi:multidrug efflux system outer membrane protein
MKRIFLTLVTALACLLGGCAVGPHYQRPAVQVPPSFPGAAAGVPSASSFGDLRWSDVFKDEALAGLIRTATSQNFDVRIAVTQILQAEQQVRFARGSLLPTAGASFAPERGINTTDLLVQGARAKTATLVPLTGTVSWEVDLWGKLRRQTEAARANFLAAKDNRELVQQSLVFSLVQAYLDLREQDNELEISRRTLEGEQQSLELTKLREEGGVASMVDVRQAETLVETAAHSIPLIEQQIATDEDTLNFLLGRNPGPVPRGRTLEQQDIAVPVPAGLPSSLLERRPDIRMAEQQLVAANAQVGIAKAAFFPEISLTASGGSLSQAFSDLFSNGTNFWSAGETSSSRSSRAGN